MLGTPSPCVKRIAFAQTALGLGETYPVQNEKVRP